VTKRSNNVNNPVPPFSSPSFERNKYSAIFPLFQLLLTISRDLELTVEAGICELYYNNSDEELNNEKNSLILYVFSGDFYNIRGMFRV
jgi:hypothetical protein